MVKRGKCQVWGWGKGVKIVGEEKVEVSATVIRKLFFLLFKEGKLRKYY